MSDDGKPQPAVGGEKFRIISLDLIDDPARPLRTDLSIDSVEDLAESIRQVGIIEPLVVKPKHGRFEVIAGHRRLVAAGAANLIEVPCYVVQVTDEQGEMLKIHENIYRLDISPTDQAEHFDYLIQHHKLSPAKIAQMVGKSESYVIDRLNILLYPEILREALASGQIKFSVAREFYRIKDEVKMREYLGYAVKNGLTPSLAEKWVDDLLRKPEPLPPFQTSTLNNIPTTTPIDSVTKCVKCTEQVKVSEATLAYFHPNCYAEVAPD